MTSHSNPPRAVDVPEETQLTQPNKLSGDPQQSDVDMTQLGVPRPLNQVVVRSLLTFLLYYAYYKWIIHDELKAHAHGSWSGALCMIPFVSGIAIGLASFHPVVPDSLLIAGLLGLVWIYISQYRLYREINRLYEAQGWRPPLVTWWLVVPGLNLWVGLRHIHFLSEYWRRLRQETISDPLVERLSWFFANEDEDLV